MQRGVVTCQWEGPMGGSGVTELGSGCSAGGVATWIRGRGMAAMNERGRTPRHPAGHNRRGRPDATGLKSTGHNAGGLGGPDG